MRHKKWIVASIISVTNLAVSAHAGTTYTEVGDAGYLIATAQHVGYGVTKVRGELDYRRLDRVDIYRLDFGEAAYIDFDVVSTGEWFKEDLFLFNASGNPILVGDSLDFQIDLQPGTYYFAVSDWDIAALGQDGETIANSTINDPNGVLAGWKVHTSPFRYGTYELRFDVATSVPEPSSGTLLLVGLSLMLIPATIRHQFQAVQTKYFERRYRF